MIDEAAKYKVLPLISYGEIVSRNEPQDASVAQRDADWQRILPLLEEVRRTLSSFPDLVDLGDALAELGLWEFHTHQEV